MHFRSAVLCIALSAVTTAAFAVPRQLNQTGARELWLENEAARNARATIVGRGVLLGGMTSAARRVPGGEVVCKKFRELTDERGLQHVYYTQYVQFDDGEVAELAGGEIAVHSDGKGNVYFVNGAQFENVALANARRIARKEAGSAARAAALRSGAFVPDPADEGAAPELMLASDGSGRRFQFVYAAAVRDTDGMEHTVEIDAESGELLAAAPNAYFSNCDVSNPTPVYAAEGVPFRSDLSHIRRDLTVTYTPPRNGYDWEAYFNGDLFSPAIIGYQVTNNTSFMCQIGTDAYAKTVFPVKDDAVYDTDGEWQGRIMGDAMYKTRQAMGALASLGYKSFDNANSRAVVVIEEPNARFYLNQMAFYFGGGDARKPNYSLVIGTTFNFPGSWASSLDAIAHEWGHGVLIARNVLGGSGQAGEIHEGFGDVMGHYAEKWNEGFSGYGVEQGSDWKIGEDTSPYLEGVRNAGQDDYTTGHTFMGRTFNDRFHKDDQSDIAAAIHERGNQLAVAFKMLWTGGNNPACSRGFGCTNMTGVGGAPMIMLKTFTVYMTTPQMQWANIPNLANRAAFDHFNKCNDPWGQIDPATIEQNAVAAAFANIGYPRTTPFINCQ